MRNCIGCLSQVDEDATSLGTSMGVQVQISDKFKEGSITWAFLSEAMLKQKNVVNPVEVFHDSWKNDMFHHFARDARKGYRTAVGGVGFYTHSKIG